MSHFMGTPAMSRGNLLACKMTSYFDGSEDTLNAGFPHARNNRIVKFPPTVFVFKKSTQSAAFPYNHENRQTNNSETRPRKRTSSSIGGKRGGGATSAAAMRACHATTKLVLFY